jgi:hypothetical protein
MQIYTPNRKIQVSILEIRYNSQNSIKGRNIRLYYESDEKKHTNIVIPTDVQINLVLLPKIDWYNQQKGSALEESESNLNYLTQVLRKYYSKNQYPTDEKHLEQSDFMKKRDILSTYLIKKDTFFHCIEDLSSKSVRSEYTSAFHHYISQRNILAHGILVYSTTKDIFYIEHKDPTTKQTAYAILNENAFSEFNCAGNNIRDVLIKMDSLLK